MNKMSRFSRQAWVDLVGVVVISVIVVAIILCVVSYGGTVLAGWLLQFDANEFWFTKVFLLAVIASVVIVAMLTRYVITHADPSYEPFEHRSYH